MQEFVANNWPWLLGTAVSLFAGIVGTAAWLRPRLTRRRLSWYTISSVPIVSQEIAAFPTVNVSFKGAEAERVTLTVIKLWNSGAAAIESNAASDLTIEVPGEALGANISGTSKEVGAVETSTTDTDVQVKFGFLNPGEGCELSILHDGSAHKDDLQVRGPLKNVAIKTLRT